MNCNLTQFATIIVEIESAINNRPLTYYYEELTKLIFPNNFLILKLTKNQYLSTVYGSAYLKNITQIVEPVKLIQIFQESKFIKHSSNRL